MRIQRNVFDKIRNAAKDQSFEIGGILGSANNAVITDFVVDHPGKCTQSRFAYYPNVHFLNQQIEVWAKRNITFIGILHTHFLNSRDLSQSDMAYIEKIMECAGGIAESLYFPVFTLPECVLTVYKASHSENGIEIAKDEFQIVNNPAG